MLTKNGKIMIKKIFHAYAKKKFGNANLEDFSYTSFKKADGNVIESTYPSEYYLFPQIGNLNLFNVSAGNPQAGLVFGNGTTDPTENDYTLGGIISINNQNISALSSKCYDDEDGNIYCDLFYIYTNNTTQNQSAVVSEFGLFSSINNSSNSGCIMLYHDVFDEPITIAPGETKYVKVTIKIDW